MKMLDIAKMYVGLSVYNEDTADTALRAARLFDERSGIASLDDVNFESIQRFRHHTLEVLGVKPITYNGYLRYLKLLGQWAADEGLMPRNWFSRVKAAPVPDVAPKGLDAEVFIAAFQYLKTPDALQPAWFWRIVIRFIYCTGVRRRQLVSVEMQDIDLEKQVMVASYRGSKTYREWEIPLTEAVVEDLRYLIQRNEDALGRLSRPDDRVFNVCRFYSRYKPDPKCPGAMPRTAVTGFMKRLAARIDRPIGAHRIRHTLATELCNPADEGVEPDLFVAQSILGHTSLRTTRKYVHTRLGRARKALSTVVIPE
jgi:integrase